MRGLITLSPLRLTRWRGLAVACAALLAAAVVAVLVVGSGSGHGTTRVAVPVTLRPAAAQVTTTTVAPLPRQGLIATLSGPTPYSAAPGGAQVGTLPADNPFGAPEVVAVTEVRDEGSGRWLHVRLPVRPNGSTGWIRGDAVSLTWTAYQVVVSLSARTLTVTDAGRVVLTTPVAVGTPTTPTPPDQTYLWELIRPDDPNGAYGPYIFGLAEFSDAYSVFNGGDAQIGIHGQDEPWSIGKAASHGCVRLPNDVITKLAGMLPLGTPVTIS
ncbi:MAG TPA: L,D-transpeptidase [Acidimicrobiales bacterium]|nr:L,D-transpeptidase [Acidimicrobiales bacterium]